MILIICEHNQTTNFSIIIISILQGNKINTLQFYKTFSFITKLLNKLYWIKDTIHKITRIYKLGCNRCQHSMLGLPKVPTCQSSLGLAFQFLVEKLWVLWFSCLIRVPAYTWGFGSYQIAYDNNGSVCFCLPEALDLAVSVWSLYGAGDSVELQPLMQLLFRILFCFGCFHLKFNYVI